MDGLGFINMATAHTWTKHVGVRAAMGGFAILKPEIETLLEALGVRPKEFLPAETDLPHPFIPKPDFNRGNAYEVIKGEKPLTRKMSRKLRNRLQILLELAIDDREELDRIVSERRRCEQAAPKDRERLLLMLTGAAVRERSASTALIEERRKTLNLIKAQRSTLGVRYAESLMQILDEIIIGRKQRGTLAQLNERLLDVSVASQSLIVLNKGRFNIADNQTLLDCFGTDTDRRQAAPRPERSSRERENAILSVTWSEPPESFTREQLLRFANILRSHGFDVKELRRAEEGCTTISITTTTDDARNILIAFRRGEFEQTGIVSIEARPLPTPSNRALDFANHDSAALRQGEPGRALPIERQLSRALRTEALLRPWRRLFYLYSPSIAHSRFWHVIAESDQRAYANPVLYRNRKSLGIDLGMTLLVWPALVALVLMFSMFRLPAGDVAIGALSGLALAIVGAQPCSVVISPLACGAGTVAMAYAFGLAHTIILTRLNLNVLIDRAHIMGDFFLSVNGGVIGISAPSWLAHFSWPVIAGLLGSIAFSIFLSGWLMGQPHRAWNRVNRWTIGEQWLGGILGAFSGIGIGLVYALNRLLANWVTQPVAFVIAFAIVGWVWIGACTYLRFYQLPTKQKLTRAFGAGGLHSISGAVLIWGTAMTAGSTPGLLLIAASCGFFQATFFTSAFVIGLRIAGARAALIATTLEGAIGFTAFVIARMVHG